VGLGQHGHGLLHGVAGAQLRHLARKPQALARAGATGRLALFAREHDHPALVARRDVGRPLGEGITAVRLLRGLASCALCGHRITTVYFGDPKKRGMSYVCAQRLVKKCSASYVHAPTLDGLVAVATLERLVELRRELARPLAPARAERRRVDPAAQAAQVRVKRDRIIAFAAAGHITEADMVAFVSANGVDGAKFSEAFRSFAVSTQATKARQLTDAYKIDGVPALGINGRFFTSGALAGSHERALAVADFLIERSRQKA
jgi:hypothetical protein